MNKENNKDLLIGMLFGLALNLRDKFDSDQNELYLLAKNMINDIYYKRDEENDK